MEKCPICGEFHAVEKDSWGTLYYCKRDKYYKLFDAMLTDIDSITKERWLNAIYNFVDQNPIDNMSTIFCWKFFYAETDKATDDESLINVYHLMKQYPYQVLDRIDKILVNISKKFPMLSDTFWIGDFSGENSRLLYCESPEKRAELISIFSILQEQNYIEIVIRRSDDNSTYRLTYKGWQRIAILVKSNNAIKQGFIAMSFDNEVEYIQNIFKQAIRQAGFEPQIIKDKEHNNYIMPEIFHEIEKSKFVVVDITKQNYGVYYEAGYAQALGKEVIVCCKKEVFDNPATRPHFDIAQKSMILWTDEQDLLDRLVRRINATVK